MQHICEIVDNARDIHLEARGGRAARNEQTVSNP